MAFGRYIGPRLSKYAQTTQDKVNHHTYTSGKTAIKAFITNNSIFYDEKKRVVKVLNKDSLQRARFFKITWRIQKNYQNGQSITLVAGIYQPKIFPMCSAMRLVLRAKWLNQPDDMPVAVYKTKKGKVIYLTGNKIAELLRKAIKEVRPDTTPDERKRYSTHSLRVWACVLLKLWGILTEARTLYPVFPITKSKIFPATLSERLLELTLQTDTNISLSQRTEIT